MTAGATLRRSNRFPVLNHRAPHDGTSRRGTGSSHAPGTGTPDVVNADPYGDGWLFEVELSEPSELDDLLDADGYAEVAGE